MLSQFDHSAICIGGMHGLNSYYFYMYTVVVIDEYGNEVPIAFCFSNRGDVVLFKRFFTYIKLQVGEIKTSTFICDGAESFYNAWSVVMGQVENRILCIWHVFKNWTENGARLVKDRNKRSLIKNTLRSLFYELDEQKFAKYIQAFQD